MIYKRANTLVPPTLEEWIQGHGKVWKQQLKLAAGAGTNRGLNLQRVFDVKVPSSSLDMQ